MTTDHQKRPQPAAIRNKRLDIEAAAPSLARRWIDGDSYDRLIEQFIHGFKHGLQTRCDVCEVAEAGER